MPTVNDMFPKPHITADDLAEGKNYAVTVKAVEQKNVFDQEAQQERPKWVLWFEEAKKYFILNKTNASEIGKIMGTDEANDWIGRQVSIYRTKVKAFGKMVDAIRVRNVEGKEDDLPPMEAPPEDEEYSEMDW